MQRRARWLLTLLLVAASLTASPQIDTRITLNVIAFDSHDKIVGDLTSQDFQVSDQGKPQRIVSFHRNTDPQAPPVVILNGGDTFSALEALGTALKPFPGRKNVIWITRGVPLSSSPAEARAAAGQGREPVDNSSLINRIATTLDHDGVTLSSVYQGTSVENGDLATLEQFADLTGGKVYHNDIEKAVKEVMAASSSGYVIEYDGPQPDGKYHKIRVICSRKGVRLQVKQGYYAN